METRVSSASELQAALQSASGGDMILLESGDYGWFNLQNLKFDDHVTIKSADGEGGARLKHITINDSNHIKLDSLTIEFGQPNHHNDKAIDIRNSDHIQVVNSEIIGHAGTKNWSDTARGREVWQNSNNLEISGNHIHHFARAAFFFGDNMTVKNNIIDNIRLDGLFFGKSNNLLVENNLLTNFYRQGTDHADYIQFDPGTSGASRDVIIRGNVMLKGTGNGDVQGIFGANHHADIHGSVFTNFLVEDNIYFDTGLNAIQFYSGDNMTLRNNTVLADPADGRVVWVRLHGPQNHSVIEDNVATQVNAEGGATASGNIIAQFRDPSKANYYGDLFVDPFADPATLEGLAPKPGAIGYGSGKGAEERFQELLSGTPDSSGSDNSGIETPGAIDSPADEGPAVGAPAIDSPVIGGLADESPAVDGNDSNEDLVDQGDPVPPVLSAEPGAFNGKGSEVVLPHQQAFELSDGILELTFTAETLSGRQALFSKDSLGYGDGGHLSVGVEDGTVIARLQSSSQSFVVQSDTAISVGNEHHAAVSFGQNGLKLHLNGELVDSNGYTGGLTGNTEPIVLGAGQGQSGGGAADNLGDFFSGTLAEVVLYEEPAGSDADGFLLS